MSNIQYNTTQQRSSLIDDVDEEAVTRNKAYCLI